MARRTKRPPTAGANHLEWLRLVEVSGPFLSLPVLKEALPQGLEADDRDVRAELKAAHSEWTEKAHDRAYHTQWIRFVLGRALELGPEVLVDGPAVPANLRVRVAVHHEELRPDFAVLGFAESGERPTRLVVQVFDAGTDLERPVDGAHWKASPVTRMVELLRGIPDGGPTLGLVTNGEQWVLVSAPRKGTTTFVTWHASLWFEEKITLQALRTLLGARRVFGPVDETLERLIERSAEHQHDVTIQLGLQVREAIELLVRRIDELDRGSGRNLLEGVTEKQVYEAAVTVMMRLVFVFYLEEQADLYFPVAKSNFYQRHYALSPLGASLRAEADRLGPDVLERRTSAWCRLLATFRAIHGGVAHVDMRLPAYGGHLFDPDRFPFLEGRKPGQGWRTNAAAPLAIDDATVLFVLEALQVLRVRDGGANGAETRRLSFRELGVEQIGNVYESLLDHTAKRAADAVVSLKGAKGEEPEIELRELEQRYNPIDTSKLVSFVKERTGRTELSIAKDLEYTVEDDPSRWLVACGNDSELYGRVKPVAGLVREDRRKQPAVYPKDSIYVTAGADRRSTGTHYTPPSLTEPVVRYALEPLVYEGPADGKPEAEWKLRSPREILSLRVCDPACGSGAFLVQACRYLSERLVEAWQALEDSHPGRLLISPMGDLSEGRVDERVIARGGTERLAIARRAVVGRCLYGVDVNPAAVEMAKLSLWLVTLQRERPFTFLDHAIKSGDSLLGVNSVKQVEHFSLRPSGRQITFATANLVHYVEDANAHRRALEDLPSNDHTDIAAKIRLHAAAEEASARVKVLADVLIAFELRNLEGNAYEEHRTEEADKAQLLMSRDGAAGIHAMGPDSELASTARAGLRGRRPFHWPVEFPEVFGGRSEQPAGFDTFVGNPPYMGGTRVSSTYGQDYLYQLVSLLPGSSGNCDLATFFIGRAGSLLGPRGTIGYVTTSAILAGDSFRAGPKRLMETGFVLMRELAREQWPGQSANVAYAALLMRRTGSQVGAIARPHALKANDDLCNRGCDVFGEGFVLSQDEVATWQRNSSASLRIVMPYLGGAEFNNDPRVESSRFIINFGEMTEDDAKMYGDAYERVERLVKPARKHVQQRDRREQWWLFATRAPVVGRYLATHSRCLAIAQLSKHIAFAFVTRQVVFANTLLLVLFDSDAHFAVLQSSLHAEWVFEWGGAMRTDTRYTSTECFETFPFPVSLNGLGGIGERYYAHRQELMSIRSEGLTRTYNRFHDRREQSEDIKQLRALHVEMDRAVVTSYGWSDLDIEHGFQSKKRGERYTLTESSRNAVIERLLDENHERYADEVKAGLHKLSPAKSRRQTRLKSALGGLPQGELTFGGHTKSSAESQHGE